MGPAKSTVYQNKQQDDSTRKRLNNSPATLNSSSFSDDSEDTTSNLPASAWRGIQFSALPNWLKDNEYLHRGHRPPMPSISACFKSVFRIHTETGNIWTHLLGFIAFILLTIWFVTRPELEIEIQEKLVFTVFFIGAIACLGLSTTYHTLHCHSETVAKIFSKLDYTGIALLIMGSFFPYIYYGFYCEKTLQIIYVSVTLSLGFCAIFASLYDKFGTPKYRPVRAGLFVIFGLSGVFPAFHYVILRGWNEAFYKGSFGWLVLMAVLYIVGAGFYAGRIPERWFPGQCDIWFQSHQVFHVLVVAAALVHYHGICQLAFHRLKNLKCDD